MNSTPWGRRSAMLMLAAAVCAGLVGCSPTTGPPANDNANTNDNANGGTEPPDVTPDGSWFNAFDASGAGALSGVWGSGPDDVFMVGGDLEQAEIYRFDGERWLVMNTPPVPLLVWVYGFGPDDVTAVGLGGGAVHYDGESWTELDSGTTEDLWGVWGPSPDDLWIVGGDVGSGDPVILHYDGAVFTPVAVPANDRNATSLFKVWGIGDRIFAVGERGVILQLIDGTWAQVPAGAQADADFVSLWGTRTDLITIVGGRATSRVAIYDGAAWSTERRSDLPGLNAVYAISDDLAVIGGALGFVGTLNPTSGEIIAEESGTQLDIHAAWDDGAGRTYAVGGQFREPYRGIALVRTTDGETIVAEPPRIAGDGTIVVVAPPFDCEGRDDDPTCVQLCTGPDTDGDGARDECDNCPGIPNANQHDKDEDGVGDACERCPGHRDDLDEDDDGIADGCDACPGANDLDDADDDGVPDGCDRCVGDDAVDGDEDGVPDACDTCEGHDDTADADGDGIADGCDRCTSGDDSLDNDQDGVPNACDQCANHDDSRDADGDGIPDGCDDCTGSADSDGDGVPDDCDRCAGADDGADADGDGVADGCDACPGSDDRIDDDGDGVPTGCDACPGSNDRVDGDGDGVPDGCDQCAGGDDGADADADGVPDACDGCAGHDDTVDADGDGVADACDLCPGFDDTIDTDGDGIPDGCCDDDTDCPVGQDCDDDFCVSAPGPDIEIGVGGWTHACVEEDYRRLKAGDAVIVCEGIQGFADIYMIVRMAGFALDREIRVSVLVSLLDTSCVQHADCEAPWFACLEELCSPFGSFTPPVRLPVDNGDGTAAVLPDPAPFFLFDTAEAFDGRPARLWVTVEDADDSAIRAEATVDIVFDSIYRCSDDECPEGQRCVDSFCLPE